MSGCRPPPYPQLIRGLQFHFSTAFLPHGYQQWTVNIQKILPFICRDAQWILRNPQTDFNHADAELSILGKKWKKLQDDKWQGCKETCKFTRSGVIFKTWSELLHWLLLQLVLQPMHSHVPNNVMGHVLKSTFLGTILVYYQVFIRLGASYTSSPSIKLR